jgi:ABC-type bacteriocin/lantibiotic exporter with double-glycine peptidase domain
MVLVDLAFVFVFIFALFYLSPALAFVVVGVIPLFVGMSLVVHHTQKRLIDENFAALAAKTSALTETVANALTVKSLGLEGEMERRWSNRLALSAWTGFRANNLVNLASSLGSGLQQAVGLLVLVIGAYLVIDGELTVGALIAANIMAGRALAPMRQVVSAWNQLHEVRSAFQRLDDIMDQPPEAEPGTSPVTPTFEGRIAFERVSFSYEQDLPPALRDVTLTIEQGEILGVMGPLGSGKSTLAKLVEGLYRPTAGRILIDRTDISHASPAALRRQLGVVPQEVQLFAGTVRENITMGADDPDPARAIASARFVGAHDFIQRLPKGYETVLRERGTGLSAGQRQLICLARAMMRNPRILILDEATSSLDTASEETFLRNLRRVARGRTVIIISHRIAPLTVADRVVVITDGQVTLEGPPSKVLELIRGPDQASPGGAVQGADESAGPGADNAPLREAAS